MLTVAYLGTPFAGWQRQPGRPTVQGELEAALGRVLGRPAAGVVGAGRTDAGVHAAGQVAHVDLPARVPPDDLCRALNRVLPEAIRIRRLRPASPRFHARRDAVAKRYVYRLRTRPAALPWVGLRTAVVPGPLDLGLLERAAARLPGTRDWASFTVTDPGPGGSVRTVYGVRARRRRDGVDLEFLGDGFLRYQVRRMVGAVLEVASGERALEDLGALLETPRPGAAIRTAAATGLTLERVWYGPLRPPPRPPEQPGAAPAVC